MLESYKKPKFLNELLYKKLLVKGRSSKIVTFDFKITYIVLKM